MRGAAAVTTLVRMFHRGSGRANWGTFAERVRAYHGVCGSLAGDLAFSCAAFVAFAVCAGTETAITTLWPWKVREYAQREWEKDRRAFHNQKRNMNNMIDAPNASKCFVRLKVGQQFFFECFQSHAKAEQRVREMREGGGKRVTAKAGPPLFRYVKIVKPTDAKGLAIL